MVTKTMRAISRGTVLILFTAIAVVAVYYLLSPAVPHYQGEDIMPYRGEGAYFDQFPTGLSYQGMHLRYQAWLEYPKYAVGMGILALMGFGGMVLAAWQLAVLKDEDIETETD